MSDQNKAIVRRLFEELWNKGNLSVADQLFSPTTLTMILRRPISAGPGE